MKVKVFDEGHEKDLEESVNKFLKENKDVIINDIQYRTSHFQSNDEQIFSFSVMIIYRVKGEENRKVFDLTQELSTKYNLGGNNNEKV